ncbi:hypothetical protein JCM11491_003587 [Sporobolomyces phaffii]
MDGPSVVQSGGSSPLSSLGSSPEPEPRPSKRPRLSSSPPSPQPLFLAQHRSPPREESGQHHQEDLHALLDGLDEEEFALPPSSDPLARRQDDSDADEDMDGDESVVTVHGKGKRREADDSGIGLLPRDVRRARVEKVEVDGAARTRSVEPPDKVTVEQDDEEFEGDDMWLGFDDADMGFDQPDAFPSSISSLAPATLKPEVSKKTDGLIVAKNSATDAHKDEADDEIHETYSKPADLAAFGFSSVISGAGGFVFATRKAILPTADALARAQDVFGDDDIERPRRPRPPGIRVRMTSRKDLASDLSTPAGASLQPSTSSFIDSPPLLAPAPLHPPSAKEPLFVGFQNGAGRSIALPDQGALDRARGAYEQTTSPPRRSSAPKSRPTSNAPSRAPSRAGRTDSDLFGAGTQNGAAAPFCLQPLPLADDVLPPSPKVLVGGFDSPTISRTRSFIQTGGLDVNDTLGGRRSPLAPVENVVPQADDARSDNDSVTDTVTSSSPRKRGSSPLPVAQARPPPTFNSLDCALSAVVPEPLPSPAAPPKSADASSARPPDSATSGSTPIAAHRAPAFRPPMLGSARNASQARSSTPIRTSLNPHTIHPLPIVSTSASATPLFNRRLNIGMTPRNKPFHLANTQPSSSGRNKGKSSFVTPFKNGKRPEGLTPTGLKDKTGATPTSGGNKVSTVASVKTRTRVSQLGGGIAKDHRAKIFDLEVDSPRFNLFEYGMRPQTHLFEELETQGFSEEILSMNSANSSGFVFPCGRSARDAFESLKALVAARLPGEEELVTLPWVQNHWSLIVWKLASYVRTRPDLLEKWWTFDMVMDQLRYRYEREINRAERSAIKRIQEKDSSAALPIVLCVTQLLWDDPEEGTDDTDGATQVVVGIELTDGWYRIRANIDRTLRSACERGKLIVGSKVAVTGARLESHRRDGVEVLEAVDRSKLVISGNSTSLAAWHAPLGFSRNQFFASLDSLSCSGGVVAPLDIVIEKIFELGYVDATRSNSGTWGEVEERERAEEWERGRKRIHDRMADAAERDGLQEDDLVALLQDAVQGACEDGLPSRKGGQDPEIEDPDEIIERLENATSKRAVLRELSLSSLQACLNSAVERATRSRDQAYHDLRQELDQKFPPRQIRSVRMMRIKDARDGASGPSEREAILTVWDVKDYASDFFREGRRYQVTNTVVKGNWQRKIREITLHTRKESKWKRVEQR